MGIRGINIVLIGGGVVYVDGLHLRVSSPQLGACPAFTSPVPRMSTSPVRLHHRSTPPWSVACGKRRTRGQIVLRWKENEASGLVLGAWDEPGNFLFPSKLLGGFCFSVRLTLQRSCDPVLSLTCYGNVRCLSILVYVQDSPQLPSAAHANDKAGGPPAAPFSCAFALPLSPPPHSLRLGTPHFARAGGEHSFSFVQQGMQRLDRPAAREQCSRWSNHKATDLVKVA